MKFKTLDYYKFKDKRVLLRSDLNSEVYNGSISMNDRISESSRTIKELILKGASVVVLAHQGRPGKEDFTSLEEHSKLLKKFVKIKFVKDIIGEDAVNEIENLKFGEAILLENVRFLEEEFKPSVHNKMVEVLSDHFDFYVNDAFSVCHREQTSIVSFPKKLKSCIGRTMERELKNLDKIKIKDCLFILGGAKEDNIILLKNDNVLTCGIFGQLCMISRGFNFGAQNEFLKKDIEVVEELKKINFTAETPIDFAVKVGNERFELDLEDFPSEYDAYDIGEKTIKEYIKRIKNVKAIFMKGPAGFAEDARFAKGTAALLKAIANSKAKKVLGGGQLSSALKRLKISEKKFDYISLSGGATVHYLAGRKLPGLEALKKV
ncbi:phosphoglycerate kinase [Candidatus Pacearchaeota archaeon]|nr:phosphoglycerate kinase [Candidatus Pacearchaeota archaeon]